MSHFGIAMDKRKREKANHRVRQEQILVHAAACFRDKGYLATTMDEIARKVGLSKAALYYFYGSKMELLDKVISIAVTDLTKKAVEIAKLDISPKDKLESMITLHIEYLLSSPGIGGVGYFERKNLTRRLLNRYVSKRDEYESLFRTVIKEGMERGQFRTADVMAVSTFILGLCNSISQWFKQTGRLSADKVVAEARQFVMAALCLSTDKHFHEEACHEGKEPEM